MENKINTQTSTVDLETIIKSLETILAKLNEGEEDG